MIAHYLHRFKVRLERSRFVLRLRYPPLAIAPNLQGRRFVFVCGLHKSGTSTLYGLLRRHPDVSGARYTVHREDEGQFMQSVYTPDPAFGGPGRFAFQQPADDFNQLVEKRDRLLREWGGYFVDPFAPVLVEKSPANLIRMVWLQHLFPEAIFIILVRHPIAVSLATQRWSGTSLEELFTHWWTAHRCMLDDLSQVNRALLLRYEDLVAVPERVLPVLQDFVGLGQPLDGSHLSSRNGRYFDRWCQQGAVRRLAARRLAGLLLKDVSQFGYRGEEPFVSEGCRIGRVRNGGLVWDQCVEGSTAHAVTP